MDAARSGVLTYGITLTIRADRSLLRDDLPTFRVSFSVFNLFFRKGCLMGTIIRGQRGRQAFTKVELVIVLFIGLISFGLLVGCVQRMRVEGSRTTCINNLKQIALGVQNYQSTFGRMPPLYGGSNGTTVVNSTNSPNVWGSTHVFLLPYIEQENLYKALGGSSEPPVYDATTNAGPAITRVVTTFMCPGDSSMTDGIVIGGTYGGTSYAANAQVFALLSDETINGGAMFPSSNVDFTDRGIKHQDMKDGSSNTIIFMHSYARCGASNTGTVWGYGAGVNQPLSPVQGFQPWSRASYLNQVYSAKAGNVVFQNAPNYAICVPGLPATPHSSALMVAMGDGSVRSVVPSISADTWNKVCLPNDGSILGEDW